MGLGNEAALLVAIKLGVGEFDLVCLLFAVVLIGFEDVLFGFLDLGGRAVVLTILLERERERERDALHRLVFPNAKFRQVPVIGPEMDPGSQIKVSKHQPQRESLTQVTHVVKAEQGDAGHSKKNQSVQLLGFPPGPLMSPVRQSPFSLQYPQLSVAIQLGQLSLN